MSFRLYKESAQCTILLFSDRKSCFVLYPCMQRFLSSGRSPFPLLFLFVQFINELNMDFLTAGAIADFLMKLNACFIVE